MAGGAGHSPVSRRKRRTSAVGTACRSYRWKIEQAETRRIRPALIFVEIVMQSDHRSNLSVSQEFAPREIVWIVIGLAIWLVLLSVWGFAGSGYVGWVLTVVSLFIGIAVGLPLLLAAIGRRRHSMDTDPTEPGYAQGVASPRVCGLQRDDTRADRGDRGASPARRSGFRHDPVRARPLPRHRRVTRAPEAGCAGVDHVALAGLNRPSFPPSLFGNEDHERGRSGA